MAHTFLAILCICGSSLAHTAVGNSLAHAPIDNSRKAFDSWAHQYGRSYQTNAEATVRYEHFRSNIQAINQAAADSPMAQFGPNDFADWSPEEFSAQRPQLTTNFWDGASEQQLFSDQTVQTALAQGDNEQWRAVKPLAVARSLPVSPSLPMPLSLPVLLSLPVPLSLSMPLSPSISFCASVSVSVPLSVLIMQLQATLIGLPKAQSPHQSAKAVAVCNPQAAVASCDLSCVATCAQFSATANIEAQWHLAGHPLVPLAVQEMIDCSSYTGRTALRLY